MRFIKECLHIKKMYASFTLLIILFLGLCLRLYHLGTFSLWHDEALSALQVRDLAYIWRGTSMASLRPLYYTLLHYWLYIGNSEFILRLLSTIFGVLSILVIYGIGKALFDSKIGLISAFLFSTSPLHIYHSQEVKMYTLFPFLVLLSIFFLVKILKKDNLALWLSFIISTALSLYTHYFAFFSLFAENVFFFSLWKRNRNLIRKWLIAQGIIFLLFLSWHHILFQHLGQTLAYTSRVLLRGNLIDLFITFKNFTIGYHATKSVYLLATSLFFLLFVLGILSLRKAKRELCLLLCLIFVPIFTTLLLSQKFHIYVTRFLISASLTYYIIVACGISYLKRYQAAPLIIIPFLLAFALNNHYLNIIPTPRDGRPGAYHRMEYREGANFIKSNFQQGDIIIHTCLASYLPFKYYFQGKPYESCVIMGPEEAEVVLKKLWAFIDRGKVLISLDDIKQATKDHKRFWMIFSQWSIDNNIPLEKCYPNPTVSHELKEWIDYPCIEEIDSKKYPGLEIYLYLNQYEFLCSD